MLVRLGPTDLDPAVRPIVLVAYPSIEHGQPLETMVKQAVGQGADLVELPVHRLDASTAAALRDAALTICVSCTQLDEIEPALAAGAAALHWNGDLAVASSVRTRLGPVPLLVSVHDHDDIEALQAGDWCVVSWEHREWLSSRAVGVLGLVDLGVRADRAELAATVTVALEGDGDGFVTVAPTAVRRAAHVIRAVERTR